MAIRDDGDFWISFPTESASQSVVAGQCSVSTDVLAIESADCRKTLSGKVVS